MEKLKISENNRFFTKEDGTPFVWLADTAWTVPARLKWDDVQYYLRTRKAQGFTVLQMVVLDPEFNEQMQNPCGVPALKDGDLLQPDEAYFSYVDWVLDQAEAYGFYVLLLPVWGQLMVGEDWSGNTYEKTIRKDNAAAYGTWLGRRMKHRKNLLWCLGGDRMPVHKGVDYRPVWRELAEGLAFGLTGKHLCWNQEHEEWKKLLFTYHACHEAETGLCSTFSYWTVEDAWISFTMLQSGHGAEKKNYELIAAEREERPDFPVWDGEPAYEMMPMTWPVTDPDCFHGTAIVRNRAYWALLAGAFGHTYGHASVWCTATQKEKNRICRYSWDEAVLSEGSMQMKILRDFMESFPLHLFTPCQERLLRQYSGEDVRTLHEQAAVCPERKRMLVYFAGQTTEQIDLQGIFTDRVSGGWFDPSDGSMTEAKKLLPQNGILSVRNDHPEGRDRVLILAEEPSGIAVAAGTYGAAERTQEAKKVFEW